MSGKTACGNNNNNSNVTSKDTRWKVKAWIYVVILNEQ